MPTNPRGRKPADDKKSPAERLAEREERFRKVAAKRTDAVLLRIDLLANCSNRSGYAYTGEQVDRIFTTLQSSLDAARSRFQAESRAERAAFTL